MRNLEKDTKNPGTRHTGRGRQEIYLSQPTDREASIAEPRNLRLSSGQQPPARSALLSFLFSHCCQERCKSRFCKELSIYRLRRASAFPAKLNACVGPAGCADQRYCIGSWIQLSRRVLDQARQHRCRCNRDAGRRSAQRGTPERKGKSRSPGQAGRNRGYRDCSPSQSRGRR
jgi:hypothetical protein